MAYVQLGHNAGPGFRLGHSCETQLFNMAEDLSQRLDRRQATDLLILDFSKAFDTVPHRRILHKPQHYWVTGRSMPPSAESCSRWLDILWYSSPFWCCAGHSTWPANVSALCQRYWHQGITSDLHQAIHCWLSSLQNHQQCRRWRTAPTGFKYHGWVVQHMAIEVQCCKMSSAQDHMTEKKPCQQSILSTAFNSEEVSHHPCLGVELTSDLSCRTHISNITSKAERILNLLWWHLYGCNQAFTTLVRPRQILLISLGPSLQTRHFGSWKIQRKAARFVTGIYSYKESVTSMLDDLQWPPLQQRRQQKRLTAFYKASNNLSLVTIPEYVKPSSGCTRTHDLAYVQLQVYEQYKNSFLPQTIREWNSLPPDLVHAASVDEFTARLRNYTF